MTIRPAIIRPVTIKDLPQLLSIEETATTFSWSEKAHADSVSQNYPSLLLEVENEIVGFIIFNFCADECHLLNVAVDKDNQSQGFASKLFQAMLETCQAKNITSIILEVRKSNKIAINWYQSLGFKEIGIRKDYYRGNAEQNKSREDAIVMQLTVI